MTADPAKAMRHIKGTGNHSDTERQMWDFEAVGKGSLGTTGLWMGQIRIAPGTVSAPHHHGAAEIGVYVRSGHPVFVFHDGSGEVRISTEPGDYVFVPPGLPHREENPDLNNAAEIVVAASAAEIPMTVLDELRPM